MGKSDPFKDRPKLPSREQIMADLNAAQDDDVVFKEIDGSTPSCQTISHDEQSEIEEATVPDKSTVDNHYNNVTKLIHLQAQLKKEPQLMQENYEKLEKLGHDVSTSITELKSAAELVMKKS